MKLVSILIICYVSYRFIFTYDEIDTQRMTLGIIIICASLYDLFSHYFRTTIFNNETKHQKLLIKQKNNRYFLTMTDIFFSKERNQNCPIEAKKIIMIQGKIENTNHEIISLTNNNFFVYDNSGKRLAFYPLSDAQKEPIQIPMGRSETFQYAYALNDESNNIEIEYFPDTTWKKPAGIWKITVTP